MKDLLVVDSLELVHQLYLDALGHLPVRLHLTAEPDEALEFARAHAPPMILLDSRLPRVDGYELATRLREGTPARDATIIGLFGHQPDLERALPLFDGFLFKPIRLDHMAWIVGQYLEDAPQRVGSARRTDMTEIADPIARIPLPTAAR